MRRPTAGRRALAPVADVDRAPPPGAAAAATSPERGSAYAEALRRITTVGMFVVAPLVVTAGVIVALAGHGFAYDFHNQFWVVGRRVLDGLSPYDLGWQDISHHVAFPYNAVAALMFVPFGLLPHGVADALFTALLLASVPLTLHLLGMRDWRVYGIVLLWVPVLEAWGYANVSLLLVLGVALMWRHRDRPFVTGLLFALLVSIKLFVWPLAVWLLATRRYAALAYAVACGLVLNLAAWAVIGFDQIAPYVKVLGLVANHAETHHSTLRWVAVRYGASRSLAYALIFALALVVGAWLFVVAHRGTEKPALMLCMAMTFLATPVTWAHYWALLIVPLALLRPRLSPLWAIPVVMAPVAILLHSVDPALAVLAQNAMVAAVVVGALRAWTPAPAAARSERALPSTLAHGLPAGE